MKTWLLRAAVVVIVAAACGSNDDDGRAGLNPGPDGSAEIPDGSILGPDGAVLVPQDPFYVIDLQGSYLNCFGGCKSQVAAKGKDATVEGLDTLAFATSVQGIVNRKGPRLYVLATGADSFWIDRATDATKSWGWAAAHPKKTLSSIDELITTFASELSGSVRWSADVPAGLDVATTAAGLENLTLVRQGSAIEAKIVAALPVKRDLVGAFANKREAAAYAHTNFLAKTKPGFLAAQQDGWPWKKLLGGSDGSDFDGPDVLSRDYLISEKAYVFDLSPWADQAPIDDPGQPAGSDRNEMISIIDSAHTAINGTELASVWGFYSIAKYTTGAHTEPVFGEWESVRIFSQHGARLTGSGGQAYGLEMGNASFHRWGGFPRHAPRNASPSPEGLADLGYINQFLLNPGFEWGDLGSWTVNTQNRVVYKSAGAPGGLEHYLETNIAAPAENIFQDAPTAVGVGDTWRLRVKYRIPAIAGATATLTLWGLNGAANEQASTTLALADNAWHDAEVKLTIASAGHTAMRAQIYFNTVGVNYDVDELRLARVTPWDDHVAPLTYMTSYMGDYDFGTSIYTVPVAVSPKVWSEASRGKIPVAWGMAPDTVDYLPGVMAYYYGSRGPGDFFTATDTGAGYVNPTYMSAADRETFIRTTRRAMGRFGESFLSFFLNGFASSPDTDVMSAWNRIGVDGAIANQLLVPTRRLVDGTPWIELDSNSWAFGGITPAAAQAAVDSAYTNRYGTAGSGTSVRFLAGRIVFTGTDEIGAAVAANRDAHPDRDLTLVDPYTFGYLARRQMDGANTNRASWMDDTIARTMAPGATITGNVTVRNDGWDSWSTTCKLGLVVSANRDATPSAPKGATVATFALPSAVGPGGSVDIPVSFAAPAAAGNAGLSYDIQCGNTWLEPARNIPYHDDVVVK